MVSQGALHTFVGLVVIKKSSVDKTTEKVGLALTFFGGLGLPFKVKSESFKNFLKASKLFQTPKSFSNQMQC